jgi:hypothetical protein
MPILTLSLCFFGPLLWAWGSGLGRLMVFGLAVAGLIMGEEVFPMARTVMATLFWGGGVVLLIERGFSRSALGSAWVGLLLLPLWVPELFLPPPAWIWLLWPGAPSAGGWDPAGEGILYQLWGSVVPGLGAQPWLSPLPAATFWFLLLLARRRKASANLLAETKE